MGLFHRLKYAVGRVVERHPYSQNLTKRMLLRMPFLLPHDRSYLGMRHLLDHKNRLFLDVGANDGMSALSFRQIDRDRRFEIVSIEPNRLHERSLARIARRDPGFRYVLTAAGDAPDTLELFTPVYRGVALHTQSSLSIDHARAMVRDYMPEFVARSVRYEQQSVTVRPLDTLRLAPGIVKIDAEGFDYRVLLGLRETIRVHRPHLLLERDASTVEQIGPFCEEMSYTLVRYDDLEDRFSKLTGAASRNLYGIPDEHVSRLMQEGNFLSREPAAGKLLPIVNA